MHPWMAQIHPGFRTGLIAWLIARAGILTMLYSKGALAPSELDPAGAPLWGALVITTQVIGSWAGWAMLAAGEIAMLVAILSVYHFCRRDTLPQTADRAAWLAALSPIAAALIPVNAWTFAAPACLCALAAAVNARHILALGCITLAISLRPELVLLAPGVAMLGWRSRQPGKTPEWAPWMLALGPVAILTLTIFASFGLAGMGGISMRTLHVEAWRQGIVWQGMEDVVFVLGIFVAVVCAAKFAGRTPKSWVFLTLPCLLWPLAHQHPGEFAPMALCAAPIFAYVAKIGEEPALERLTLAISAMLLLIML